MRILIPGGSGQIGTFLARHLHASGHEVTVLSRDVRSGQGRPWRTLKWDGSTPGAWIGEIDRTDAVIHLSGKSGELPLQRRESPRHFRLAREADATAGRSDCCIAHAAELVAECEHEHVLPAQL